MSSYLRRLRGKRRAKRQQRRRAMPTSFNPDDIKDWTEKQEVKAPEFIPSVGSQGLSFWVWAIEGGKRYCLGPYSTESQANDEGSNKLDGDFEVVALNTRSSSEATRQLKARDFRRGKDKTLGQATRRVGHEGTGQRGVQG